jgi:hypothetical protein
VQYEFPAFVVVVDETWHYVETRFADGTKVGSTPNRDAWSLHIAETLGYGDDTWTMSRDHELGHAWLAHLAGLPWSPTMWRLAHPDDDGVPDDIAVAEEESRVLAWQRTLDKDAPRPWDVGDEPRRVDGTPW